MTYGNDDEPDGCDCDFKEDPTLDYELPPADGGIGQAAVPDAPLLPLRRAVVAIGEGGSGGRASNEGGPVTVASMGGGVAGAYSHVPAREPDGCDLDFKDDPTHDEELPEAVGGVQ